MYFQGRQACKYTYFSFKNSARKCTPVFEALDDKTLLFYQCNMMKDPTQSHKSKFIVQANDYNVYHISIKNVKFINTFFLVKKESSGKNQGKTYPVIDAPFHGKHDGTNYNSM